MNYQTKQKLKTWILIIMISALISSFLLFFMGYYMTAFVISGIFIGMATIVSQWVSHKNRDYLFREMLKNNRDEL